LALPKPLTSETLLKNPSTRRRDSALEQAQLVTILTALLTGTATMTTVAKEKRNALIKDDFS